MIRRLAPGAADGLGRVDLGWTVGGSTSIESSSTTTAGAVDFSGGRKICVGDPGELALNRVKASLAGDEGEKAVEADPGVLGGVLVFGGVDAGVLDCFGGGDEGSTCAGFEGTEKSDSAGVFVKKLPKVDCFLANPGEEGEAPACGGFVGDCSARFASTCRLSSSALSFLSFIYKENMNWRASEDTMPLGWEQRPEPARDFTLQNASKTASI